MCEKKSQILRQRRTFASSTAFQAGHAVPSFTKTSSSELDDLLSRFRNYVFFPSYLNTEHKLLVYRAKHKKLLEEEPFNVNLGGEVWRLQHIDRTGGQLPSHTKGIIQAADLMKTKQDWLNIIPLLAGYKNSSNPLSPEQKDRLVRKAGKAGRIGVLIDAAKRVDYTGFTLESPHLVTEMAWYAQYDGAKSKWAKITASLSYVEEIAFLLEDKRHGGGFVIKEDDPRVRPELIGILLQLSAVFAVQKRGSGSSPEDQTKAKEKVKKYAERLRAVIEQGREISLSGTTSKYGEDHIFLYRMVPIVHGMQLAQKVLDPKSALTNWLKAQSNIYLKAVRKTYDKLRRESGRQKGIRSLDCYKSLLS